MFHCGLHLGNWLRGWSLLSWISSSLVDHAEAASLLDDGVLDGCAVASATGGVGVHWALVAVADAAPRAVAVIRLLRLVSMFGSDGSELIAMKVQMNLHVTGLAD
jgi:hypothetical protein